MIGSMIRRAVLICAASATVFAGPTRTWSEEEYADFQKAAVKNISLRSDGLLTLAPRWKEYYDSAAVYLWSLARDSKGNLYAGGGTGARIYRIGSEGKGKMLADLDALEIHALAVDSKDRIYAATEPDGKVYRVSGNGKPELYYEPKAKYIWALAFDRQDNLFVATGDPGAIHRVTPDGKGTVFFASDEMHVRSLAVDGKGNVIAGTAPGGLVIRVSPAGEGFVLYQMPKAEVTALTTGPDGSIYAAAVGNRGPSAAPAPPPAPAPAPTAANTRQAAPPGALATGAVNVNGGSEVYRIDATGAPHRLWNSGQDVVYAVALDGAGRVILGAGNRGNIYRVESPTTYTALLQVPAAQVTAFQSGPGGRLYAATGNVGKVYEIDSALEQQGTVESDVFDAGMFTAWGRITFDAHLNGGRVSIQTRTGNLDQPQRNWSPWSAAIATPEGGRITSPAARFIQWKATLDAGSTGSPELQEVDVAYLPKNAEPRIDRIETTPVNYRFPPAAAAPPPPVLALGPMTRQSGRSDVANGVVNESPNTTSPSMQFAKGVMGVRWVASDPNGDSLVYTVEIRGAGETTWKPLKDKVAEKYFSWDTTAFPDGEYRVRITASDAPSNPPGEALTTSMESDPFVIDNTPPRITGLTATRNGGKLEARWHAADTLNNIGKAEFSLDGGDWTVAAPVGGLSDSMELDYQLTLDAAAGEHTIAVRVEDAYANQSAEKTTVKQ